MSQKQQRAGGGTNPYLLLTTTMVLWGSGFSSSKVVVDHLPHSVAALLRFGGGAVVLLVALRFVPSQRPTSGRDVGRAAGAGILGVFLYNLLFFWGLSLAPAMDSTTIIPVMSPVLTTGFLLITRKERASAGRVAGLALGLTGAVIFLIGARTDAGAGSDRFIGDVLFLLSAGCWAAFTLLGPRVLAGIEPLRATAYAMTCGAILLGLYSVPSAMDADWGAVPATTWINAVFVAIGPTAVANLFYYRGVGAVGPASASIMMFMVPAVGTLCSYLFLGETFGAVQAVGAVVLLAGAVLAVTQGRVRPKAGETAEAVATAGAEDAEDRERLR
ncbi:DMT family transporter [Streptomyces sp. NPDC021098]|uniref:DMT family transporter n=1 Tax=unclassified Streptomyces TaxID=2593676 RepID=UPI0037B88601